MYERLKGLLLRLAKVPPEPLDPMGDVQSLRVFRAAPDYLRYIIAGWVIAQTSVLIGGVIGLTASFVAISRTGAPAIITASIAVIGLLVLLMQAIVTYFWLRLNYELRWYKVTDRSLRIRSGVWNVHEMTMTFANVQNISIAQGPLERLFGISDVRVETAGGGKSSPHGKGDGLGGVNLHVGVFRSVDNPEEIRDLMLERLRRLRDTGLGDLDDTRDHGATPARVAGLGAGSEMLNVLVAFRDEARALRRVAEDDPPNYDRGSKV
jgi:membrane protein YdbS with pleckstrin-like domain